MFLGLRRTTGVSAADLPDVQGGYAGKFMDGSWKSTRQEGLLMICDRQIFLTEQGRDLANYVMEGFLEE